MQNELGEVEEVYNKINFHFVEGKKFFIEKNYVKSEEELLKFCTYAEKMKTNKIKKKLYSPNNPLEYILLCRDTNKEILDVGNDFANGYFILGKIYLNLGCLDKAMVNFKLSVLWNPYNIDSYFSMIEIKKTKREINSIKKMLNNLYDKIYLPGHLARYYRNLGYYYVIKKKYLLAKALYLYSLKFDNRKDDKVIDNLKLINDLSSNESLDIEAQKELQDFKIPIFFHKNIVEMINILNEVNDEKTKFTKNIRALKIYYDSFNINV